MKVLCIKDEPSDRRFDLIVGEEYTAINTRQGIGAKKGVLVYELEGKDRGYWVGYFAPLSSIDEKEFERNYIKETV